MRKVNFHPEFKVWLLSRQDLIGKMASYANVSTESMKRWIKEEVLSVFSYGLLLVILDYMNANILYIQYWEDEKECYKVAEGMNGFIHPSELLLIENSDPKSTVEYKLSENSKERLETTLAAFGSDFEKLAKTE